MTQRDGRDPHRQWLWDSRPIPLRPLSAINRSRPLLLSLSIGHRSNRAGVVLLRMFVGAIDL